MMTVGNLGNGGALGALGTTTLVAQGPQGPQAFQILGGVRGAPGGYGTYAQPGVQVGAPVGVQGMVPVMLRYVRLWLTHVKTKNVII